jgi:hypothetical protein
MEGYTRLSARVVVSRDIMNFFDSRARSLGLDLEAKIPHGRDFIVSLGFNAPERRLTSEQNSTYRNFLARRLTKLANASPDIPSTLRAVRDEGYQIHTIEGVNTERQIQALGMHTDSFARLLEVTFGYLNHDAVNVLQRPTNIVSLAVKNGKPAGMCVVEKLEITIGNEKWHIAELTDVVVASEHNHGTQYETHYGKNLYLALTTHALAKMSEFPEYLIFGEYTLTHNTSPVSSRRQGQKAAGILPYHTEVDGKPTSFAVMYVPNNAILTNLHALTEALR